jgi:hypothetical protein
MMKNVAFILMMIFLFSCMGKNDAGTAHEGVSLNYVDSIGTRLYQTDGYDGYWVDSIRIYDITEGVKTKISPCYETGLPYSFQIGLQICANQHIVNRYYNTLIHLKSGVDDTLRVHINSNTLTPGTNNDSVWYNGQLKYMDSAVYRIVK